MRKILILCLFVFMLIGAVNADTFLNLELWNRWTYQMIDGADDAVTNDLALKRGYVGVSHQFNEQICGKFLVDFFSSANTSYGAGMKARLAYVNFKNYFVDDLDFTFGLMKVNFGTLYDWSYPTIALSPNDRYGTLASTDYGFGAHWLIPNKMGEIHIAAYNGEGYANGNHDTNMAFLGNLRVEPVKGITLGGSYYMKNIADTEENPEIDDDEFSAMTGFLRFKMLPWLNLTAQYISQTTTYGMYDIDITSSVISFIPIVDLRDLADMDMEAVLRYDMYDDDTDVDNDVSGSMAFDYMVAGVNYYLLRNDMEKPLLFVQANYSMTDYKYEELDDCSAIELQLRWKFSEKLN